MTDDMVLRTSGTPSDSRFVGAVLWSLAYILNAVKDELVKLYVADSGAYGDDESLFRAFHRDLRYAWSEAVSAIEHLYIHHPNYVQLRELLTMMPRGRCVPHNGRFSGRNNRRIRNASGTEPVRNPTSCPLSEDDDDSSDSETNISSLTFDWADDDSSDFETILPSTTFTRPDDEEESEPDDDDTFSESDSDQDYYYSYLSISDLASDGASIHSEESVSDDEELSDEEFFDEHEDWSKPVRLATTCHVLTENVVRELVRREYVPQWFDVVDLVLENDEQISKGPAESDCVGVKRAKEDPGEIFKKLINKELLRDEQARMISLVETAPESTRLEITATTLFTQQSQRPR